MAFDDRDTADGLDAYLDGVVRRRPPAASPLDPAFAETVRRFHALGAATAPRPEASFVAKLEADLMADPISPAPVFGTAIANGHVPSTRLGPNATTAPERRGWLITALLVAAVVLLTVAVGLSANRGEPGGPDPDGRGLGAVQPAPATPEGRPTETLQGGTVAEICDLEPRASGKPLGRLGTPTASLSFPPDVEFDPMSGLSAVSEASLPTGPPAATGVAAGIKSTLVAFAACNQAGDANRRFAVFTDDYFRRPSTRPEGAPLRLPPLPTSVHVARSMIIVGPRLLPDGRVGAVVTPPAGPLLFLVVVERDGRWLIDEYVPVEGGFAEEAPSSLAAATPASADAAATPGGFAPTHRVVDGQSTGLRPTPSHLGPSMVALPPGTPLQHLNEVASTDANGENGLLQEGDRWLRFRIENGREGWILEVDVEPLEGDSNASAATPVPFVPTHRIPDSITVNLRPGPSTDGQPVAALPPGSRLESLDEDVLPAPDGTHWMRFRTEDGQEGWIRDIDVEPLSAVPDAVMPAPTVTPLSADPTPAVSAAAGSALDPIPRTETVQADLDAVLTKDAAALDALRAELRDALAKYGTGCRAGFVLVAGNGELGEGNVLASAVLEMLQTDFPDTFGEIVGEVFAQPGVEPRGEVTLQIFFFQGCRPSAP